MINKKVIVIVTSIITIIIVVLYLFRFTSIDAKKYGQNCRIEKVCFNLIGVDCGSSTDGPYYYIDRRNEEIISSCGGERRISNIQQKCPPEEWMCKVY